MLVEVAVQHLAQVNAAVATVLGVQRHSAVVEREQATAFIVEHPATCCQSMCHGSVPCHLIVPQGRLSCISEALMPVLAHSVHPGMLGRDLQLVFDIVARQHQILCALRQLH